MSSIQTPPDNSTELRLDYKDIPAGQLVIVIQGLPIAAASFARSAGRELVALSAVDPATVPAGGSNGKGHDGSSLPPLLEQTGVMNGTPVYAPVLVTSLLLAAWRGQETRALELVAALLEDPPAEDEPRSAALAEYAKAVLYNGLGRYEDALAAAELACVHDEIGPSIWALSELVEAAARHHAHEVAIDALHRLARQTRACRGEWALGIRARSAALSSESDRAEALYREAIAHLDRSRNEIHLARTQLVYGEWLRRQNRRLDARPQLRAAHDTFRRHAAGAFAERALRELQATAETARKRSDEARAYLTPQEAQIAWLARDGLSNPEIGAQLFISPRTAQYHLRKVFRKLEITSRNHLARVPADRLGAGRDERAPRL